MCGRYTLTHADALVARFHAALPATLVTPTYNAAPSPGQLTILHTMPHLITVSAWGFVPEWAAGRQDIKPLINARAETITTTPFLRDAFKKKRCFVFADGFYEWRRTKEGKVPYRIAFKTEALLAFAGMWSTVHDVAGQPQSTFAIITTMSNERVAPMHPRMPVILHAADEADWLDPQRSLPEVQAMLVPFPAEPLTVYTVSTQVNATAHHTPEVLQCV